MGMWQDTYDSVLKGCRLGQLQFPSANAVRCVSSTNGVTESTAISVKPQNAVLNCASTSQDDTTDLLQS